MLGQSYLGAGQYEEAFQAFMEGASRLEPAEAALDQRTYEELGMEGLLRVFLDTWVWRPYDIAGISALLGEDDQAFAWLEKSYEATNWTFLRRTLGSTHSAAIRAAKSSCAR